MTPTEQDKKLEIALMELFCRNEEFGRTFFTCASKEEFAEAVNGGALDHQQAAHEAMQLITADRKRVELEARLDEAKLVAQLFVGLPTKTMKRADLKDYLVYRIAELKAQQEEV